MFYQTNCPQAAERAEKAVFLSPVALTFDLSSLNSSRRGTKHVFHVDLEQFRSAVPRDISYTTKKPQTDGAKNRTSRSSLRAVIMQCNVQNPVLLY